MEILVAVVVTTFVMDQAWRYRMRKFMEETMISHQKCLHDIEAVYQKEIDRLKALVTGDK